MTETSRQKSTIVRVMPPWVPVLARASFGTLEWVAPGVGARWGRRLWLTPPRERGHRRSAGPPDLPAGRRFTVPLVAGPPPAGGAGQIVAETWGSGPVVYLVHGWGGTRSHLAGFVPPLVAAGMQVVAFDAPAHGESGRGQHGGRRTTIPEFVTALNAVAAVTGPAYAVIAHSGGCAAIGHAVRAGLTAERLVFVAPMAHVTAYLGEFLRLLGMGPRTQRRLQRLLVRTIGHDLAEFDLPARIATADKLPELLVVHDRDDKELPHDHGQAIAGAWPGAKLVTTSGLGHRRLLADPEVIKTVVSYVTAARA